MENKPRFDLAPALERWRKTLEPSPSLREQDLQELVAHLRDSIQELESKGLGTEEAFLIATRRVGSSRELEREFGKANPRRLWLDRGLWLLLGFMVFEWINACGAAVGTHIANALLAQGASEYRTGVLSLLVTVSIEAGLVLWGWRWLTRRRTLTAHWLGECLRRPWLVALGLVLLNYFRWPLVDGLMGLAAPVTDAFLDLAAPWTTPVAGARALEEAATLTAWQYWGSEVRFLLYLVGFVYLARGYFRMTGKISPACDTSVAERPALMEAPEVRALERLGLSEQEALFLIERRTVEPARGSSPDAACWPQVWAERGLWMLAGTFLARGLWPLQDLVQLAAGFLVSGLFLNGHAAGLLALIIQAFILWSLTAHLWRQATRSEYCCRRLGRLVLARPALSMLGFLGAGYALQSLAVWLTTTFSPTISALNIGGGSAFYYWYQGNHELWYNLIPVVLVVWLARGRWRENLVEPCQPE